jgi:isopentenyl-diphosphate delta-isomerase
MNTVPEVVSSDLEDLILVNSSDEDIGTMAKRDCHLNDGILHRAFSVFIFNAAGDVLLQKRSEQKFLWPMYWSNACCSHPRVGEDAEEAAHRRLQQELGITTPLTFLYKFEYQAAYNEVGSENELCWVWVGFAEQADITPNTNEIADWRLFSRDELNQELINNPDSYTPWMKMEWERIVTEHQPSLNP